MIDKKLLIDLYINKKKSSREVADFIRCSEHKVNYWLKNHDIKKRTISEAIYNQKNPNGDPFKFKKIKTLEDAFLSGLGIGLYWGEGTKRDTSSVRLGNSDPNLIKKFIEYLEKMWDIDRGKLRFGLQIFDDMSQSETLKFWQRYLDVYSDQFYKTMYKPSSGPGTYNKKSKYGVLTIYFSNKKLRDIICGQIENMYN